MSDNTATPTPVEENTNETPTPVMENTAGGDDFSIGAPSNTEPADNTPPADETGEYALDLEGLDDEDMAYADIMTASAKDAGLDSAAASKCFKGFCEKIREKHLEVAKEEVSALKKEWGRNYAKKKDDTRNFMANLFSKAGLTAEEMQVFANPQHIRLFAKIKGALGSSAHSAGAAPAAPAKSLDEQFKEALNEWTSERYSQAPDPVKLRQLRDKVNTLSNKIMGVNAVS